MGILLVSFLYIHDAYAVTVYPGVSFANSHTNYTANVNPNFNVTSINVTPSHIYFGSAYYDLNDTGFAPMYANMTMFHEGVNASFYITATHAHTHLFVGDVVQQVFLGNTPQIYGTTWFFTPAAGGYTDVTVSPHTSVTVSFIPANFTTTGGCQLTNSINGSATNGIATITPVISWFCNPPTLNVTASYLNQDGNFILINSTTNTINSHVFNILPSFHTPLSNIGTFYVVSVVTDGSHTYLLKSNSLTLVNMGNLPLNFWTLKYGATHQYNQSSNSLETIVHSTAAPLTYTNIIKSSNGTIAINQTYTTPTTMDQRHYNITGISKPASLYVYAGGNLIYSAYMGSPISLASTSAFFNQYFSYQGFSLLSLIPIVFASMFTRNTVGIGIALTVVCIATISWMSIVVLPDVYIGIMILIAVLSMIAYRINYG